MSFLRRSALSLAAFFLSFHGAANAASYCISTTNDLIQKINSFDTQPDGSTLTIKLVQGA